MLPVLGAFKPYVESLMGRLGQELPQFENPLRGSLASAMLGSGKGYSHSEAFKFFRKHVMSDQ